ncbi:hypothetical protein MNBD_GAMMA17-3 [hydrothermal vent metagenome]|uniref:Uncharacterized protein n=1 Tax=hydrothermal vent metagenome TaxID=652676 RepID=A0A3B0Z2A8_9ZZZZ
MNKKTAVLNYIMRRQRNRRIKITLFAVVIAGLMGWALTYSQQQAFSLTQPTVGQANKPPTAADSNKASPSKD